MAIHLVGETLDKHRGHYQAGTGKLIQLTRGVYVDASDDIDISVMTHAVRISRYLYPRAYLSAASAVLLGPTRDGRLFLSGRRKQRTRIRALEIIQNEAPPHPSLGSAVIDDGMGEFLVDVSSIRQRFLEAFRLRSEHAASIDDTTREALAKRLVEENGTPQAAATAIWALARENAWYREGENAERFLLRTHAPVAMRNEAALNLTVAWHGDPIGNLLYDGFEWRWLSTERHGPIVVRQTTPGKLPAFILSLLPEGWLEAVLNEKDERTALRTGKRYMSNIAIVESPRELDKLPRDVLRKALASYSDAGVFTGAYSGPGRGGIEEDFERNLARLFASAETPRLSGIQIKAPMYLDDKGVLSPATDKPFTHILKPAGTSGFESLPIVEYLSLEFGREAGFDVPATSLVPMPDGLPPSLVIERFDIRRGAEDRTKIALEDACSVLDLPPAAKYDSTMERVVRSFRSLSTAPDDDANTLYRRALFAWFIADGDMHLKNLALLKFAAPGDTRFRSVRVAPLYDAVTTRVFPRLANDRMALKLNGKDNGLRRRDFRAFASTAGIAAADADAAADAMLSSLTRALERIRLPSIPGLTKESKAAATNLFEIVHRQIESFQ